MLTLMAVHAHPDDEVISTGGVLAKAAAAGIRTVLVTCTDGSAGDGPGGIKPIDPAHDPAAVAATRRAELVRSCTILGVSHLEMLDHPDSGIPEWPTARSDRAFSNLAVEDVRPGLDALLQRYRPDVLITYDENGNSGHPDHKMTHRVAMASVAALADTGVPRRVYWAAIPRSSLEQGRAALEAAGMDPNQMPDPSMGTPDQALAARVDVSAHAQQKRDALAAHASQSDGAFLLGLSTDLSTQIFSQETFVQAVPPWTGGQPVTDLFHGLEDGAGQLRAR
ncbi:MAG: PIG-L family deacetylase [Mycobacteriaceae bacterium]